MQPLERLASRADVDEAADDVAHHVLQKSVCCKFKAQHVAPLRYVEFAKFFPRCLCLAFSCPEGAVIVSSDDQGGRSSHGFDVQRRMEPSNTIMQKTWTLWPVQQPIHVASPCR